MTAKKLAKQTVQHNQTSHTQQAAKTTATSKRTNVGVAATRRLKKPQYKSFKLHPRIKSTAPKLPSSFKLFQTTIRTIWTHKNFFIKLALVYGLLTLIFVRGFGGGINVGELKTAFRDAYQENLNNYNTSLGIFAYLLGTAVSTNSDSEVVKQYQFIFFILVSLVTIWSMRQLLTGARVTVKEAFYKGLYPLVPFVLVLLVLALQMMPLIIGNYIQTTVQTLGLAVSGLEQFILTLLFGLSALLSLYMVSSSLFALYIVALPDMTPMRALRSARKLVVHRRFTVMRKLALLPIFLVAVAAVLVIPVLIWVDWLAEPMFYILTMLGLPAVHVYLYTLYRELLKEQ